MLSRKYDFVSAKPVWAKGREHEKNLNIIFSGDFTFGKDDKIMLHIAASSSYQLWLNGSMISSGPARCGHGFYRADEINLSGKALKRKNHIEIIVAGYAVNAFSVIDQDSFCCAEVIKNGKAVLKTATNASDKAAFKARVYGERVQKVQRYSFQRPFAEVYRLNAAGIAEETPSLAEYDKNFLERGIPQCDFSEISAKKVIARGGAKFSRIEENRRFMDRAIANISPALEGYRIDELETCSAWNAQGLEFYPESDKAVRYCKTKETVLSGSYAVFDFGREVTGMIGLSVKCTEETVIYALFDEILTDDNPHNVDFLRLGCSNVIEWHLKPGEYRLLTFEPYSYRFLKLVSLGSASVSGVHTRAYTFAQIPARKFDDEVIQEIYCSAVETFRQNTTDIYMDCPSRERAGWLCDSFFTSRSEYKLTGHSFVERNFLENFLLPESFKCLPEGMLPMCYPSDHYDGVFIPNWAMWYVVELGEYYSRTADRELVDFAKKRVYGLIKYFEKFENEFGLLEKLESWVFLEWSKSNELTQDVNFPSNFLYAKVLKTAGELYCDEELSKKGDKLLKTAAEMSRYGLFFCDNAVRKNGALVLSGECTESCQYYAFYLGAATPETHSELFEVLLNDFGPDRQKLGKWPEIYPSNAFIGNYLRLDMLYTLGYKDAVRENIKGYFKYMADRTGTLWENVGAYASCNHGFASHVVCWLE